jgi:hypothetical protein
MGIVDDGRWSAARMVPYETTGGYLSATMDAPVKNHAGHADFALDSDFTLCKV